MHPASHHCWPEPGRDHDLCQQIQVDLSAMLDGELDPAGVRRVTMHSDACPTCRRFFDGIRRQAGLHRRLAAPRREGPGAAKRHREHQHDEAWRADLARDQRKLGRVLYELGRNFVLLGLSPEFSRFVAEEPMPLPAAVARGRALIDEIACSGRDATEWVPAKELFDGGLRTPDENLARGQRLLSECLALDSSRDDARIYLGLVHYARGQRALARKQFRLVLSRGADATMCAYARLHLSNILLDEGDRRAAISALLEVVESSALESAPQFAHALFNLALAYGLDADFEQSARWFGRLYKEAPQRRAWVAHELSRRSHFQHLVHTHPRGRRLAQKLASWFSGPQRARCADGPTVR